ARGAPIRYADSAKGMSIAQAEGGRRAPGGGGGRTAAGSAGGSAVSADKFRVFRGRVRGDRAVRPLAHHEQEILLLDEDERPLLGRGLVAPRHHLANAVQLLLDRRVAAVPHQWVPLLYIAVFTCGRAT